MAWELREARGHFDHRWGQGSRGGFVSERLRFKGVGGSDTG